MTDAYLLKKYGITLRERQRMFKDQKGCCAICGKHESEFKRKLHVDHNHKSKQVRGLLCFMCNRFRVGRLTLEWAKKVYEYLAKHENTLCKP